jgi:hypothetical protein
MISTLPFVPSVPFYRFSVLLENAVYVFDVRWNSRAEQWAFDISEEDGTAIIHGAVVVLGAYMGRTSAHQLLMGGVLVARDTSNESREATLDDLGTRVKVLYVPRADMVSEIIAAATGSPQSTTTETPTGTFA